MITEAMQTRKINFSLRDLLCTALLIEHGGILIDLNSVLLTENLSWILSILEGRQPEPNYPKVNFSK